MKTVTVAEARHGLAELIHTVENGQAVLITRRGQPVATLLSHAEYERLLEAAANASNFAGWAQQWRQSLPGGFEGVTQDELARWVEG